MDIHDAVIVNLIPEVIDRAIKSLETSLLRADALRYQHLMNLLKSGVPVHLSEGKLLTIGKLRPERPRVGQPFSSKYREALGGEIKIIAILRSHEILLPHSITLLQAGDRLLTIISPQIKERLERHVAPLSSR